MTSTLSTPYEVVVVVVATHVCRVTAPTIAAARKDAMVIYEGGHTSLVCEDIVAIEVRDIDTGTGGQP